MANRNRNRNRNGQATLIGDAGSAPSPGAAPVLVVAAMDVSNDSDSVYATSLSFDLEANSEYVIECRVGIESVNFTGATFRLDGIPSGATGVWGMSNNPAASSSYRTRSGDLSDSLVMAAVFGGTETPVIIRMYVSTGANGGTMNLQHISGTNGNAVVVKAGSVALVRKNPDVTVVPSDIIADSDSTFNEVFSLSFEAGKETLVDVDVLYDSVAGGTAPVWRFDLSGAGASMLVGYVVNQGDGSSRSGIRTDDTLIAGTAAKTSGNLARMRILVTTTTNAATLSIKVRSNVDTSAITIKDGSFARQVDVTSTVQKLALNVDATTTTPVTTFSHSVEADKNYWITSLANYTSAGSTEGLRTDIDGIPSGASALFVSQHPRGVQQFGGQLKRDNTDFVSPGGDNTNMPWFDDGVLRVGANAGTFLQRHGAETGVGALLRVLAGSFALAEEVAVAA